MSFVPFSRTVTLWITLLLVIVCSGFFVLANGLHVDRVSLANVSAEDITLKWHNGLNLVINHLQVAPPTVPIQLNEKYIKRAFNTYRFLRKLIPSITIRSLDYTHFNIRIVSTNQPSPPALTLILNSPDFRLEASFIQEQDDIQIKIHNLFSKRFKSSATGTFLADPDTLQVHGQLTAKLADYLPVQLSVQADPTGISFQGRGTDAIHTLKPLVDLFEMDKDIRPWITDYLTGSRYLLQKISGTVPWHDPAAILDTLTASIRIDDCSYTFARGLEPIKAEYAEVTFSRGVLHILPHGATFHGQKGQESRLDINFNDPDNILLTVHINTRAQAEESILALLKYYDIRLPFLQTVGKTAADLTLIINLNNEEVEAVGKFDVDKGLFRYRGATYRISGGRIKLKGTEITLDGLDIGLKNFFTARISGKIQTRKERTDLAIELKELQTAFDNTTLRLDRSGRAPVQISYHSRPGSSWITATSSHWLLGKTALHLGSFSAPFDVDQLSGKLPPTRLVLPSMAELTVGGKYNLNKLQADLQVILHHLQVQSFGLNQKSLALAIHYDRKQLTVTSRKPSNWLMAGLDVTLSPFALNYRNGRLRLEKMQLHSADLLNTQVQGSYALDTQLGQFQLKNLLFSRKDHTPFLEFPDQLRLTVETDAGMTSVNLDELGLSLHSQESGGWEVNISDMGKLLDRSPLLRRFKISTGKFLLNTTSPSSPLRFTGEVTSSYALLVQNGRPQSKYAFSGWYDKTGLNLVLNKDLHVRYHDTITVHSKNIGYNVPALLRFNKDNPEQDGPGDPDNDTPDIFLQAENSFLFFRPGSRILADTMTLTSRGNKRDLNISYGPGKIAVKIVDDDFILQGDKLNARFMNELIVDAEFENGYLTAFAEGTFDKFTAVLHTDAILLKNYATLNNILAVINTLPALITFSLPHYAANGWPVDSIGLWFDYDQGIATVKALEVDSPEMDMRGAGTIDVLNQQVNLDINLITQAGKNMSKIPLIGYILAGEEERPTLTFHVTGNLLDPKVESTAFEEIITSPFDMVLRTLATPFKWARKLFHQDQADESKPAKDVNKIEHEQ